MARVEVVMSSMGRIVIVSSIIGVLGACAAQPGQAPGARKDPRSALVPPSGIGRSQQSLVGGRTTTERPEVGRIGTSGGGTCTGTLVGSDTVISAAHCS